jgi:uncharacterized membrane-anchored protein
MRGNFTHVTVDHGAGIATGTFEGDQTMVYSVRNMRAAILLVVCALIAFSENSLAQEVEWIEGPRVVDIGDNLAELVISEKYVFADGDDTRRLMAAMGNPPTGTEVGIVVPTGEDVSWFLVFEYNKVGYVKDDEKDKIDADALLTDIRNGTGEANKERAEMGFAPLFIVGWYEPPHYDDVTNNLVWAILGESEGDRIVNYNSKILGREGYMSTVLVADPDELDAIKGEVNRLMATFSYNEGKRYAEFKKGDKIAQYGLTALIAGGAGAVAVKTGLFAALGKFIAKLGKFLIVIVVAVLAFLRKTLAGIFRWLRGSSSDNVATRDPQSGGDSDTGPRDDVS